MRSTAFLRFRRGRAARPFVTGVLATILGCGCALIPSAAATAGPGPSQPPAPATATPAAVAFARQMVPGWNLGNSLEAMGGGGRTSQETAWGNPPVTQAMMNAVAAAGFRSVRIPVAWNQYADADGKISAAWLNRVAQVVDHARKAGLYVLINTHWDGGWLQPTYADRAVADAKLAKFWTQIATKFRDYDDHLLFAGTNEVMVTGKYDAPTAENCTVQNGFNRIFVDAVRATGGGNANRYLVVQGYNTNVDHTLSCNAVLPGDSATGRLMMEVHYYDPFDLTLNEKSPVWQWGAGATDPKAVQPWGNESRADTAFAKLKAAFVDKGVPVVLGEYGAILKADHDPAGNYRTIWNEYVTRSAVRHGMVPFYWDNGATGDHSTGLFNRADATVTYPALVGAIVAAAR